jgi:hypothetical protein
MNFLVCLFVRRGRAGCRIALRMAFVLATDKGLNSRLYKSTCYAALPRTGSY